MNRPLPILYQENTLIAINKPSGLLVHRSEVDRYETRNAMKLLRDQLNCWVYPLHRLDKPTSGVLVFALEREMAREMTKVFSGQQVSKYYWAVVRGYTKEEGTISQPLKERFDKMTDRLADREKEAQVAITEYRRLATAELPYPVGRYLTARYSLLEVVPRTGRNRQIRRHMQGIFHPVLGDTSHGDNKQNQFFREHFQNPRLLLHCRKLEFDHPSSGKRICIEAPLDEWFIHIFRGLGWESLV